MNKFVKKKINLKHNAWFKYKRTLLPSDHLIYTQHRNECNAAVRKASMILKIYSFMGSR